MYNLPTIKLMPHSWIKSRYILFMTKSNNGDINGVSKLFGCVNGNVNGSILYHNF